MECGRPQLAIEFTRAALRLNPDDPGLQANLGLAHLFSEQPRAARVVIDAALAKDRTTRSHKPSRDSWMMSCKENVRVPSGDLMSNLAKALRAFRSKKLNCVRYGRHDHETRFELEVSN